jgi:Putative 2OG-Fe(II) oxygenase
MDIPYQHYYWGPYLWRTRLPLEITQELIRRGQDSTFDHSTDLASINIDSRLLKVKDREWLIGVLEPYFKCYSDTLIANYKYDKDKIQGMSLTTAWINFQTKNNANPEHVHNGDFSFVIYCQIPEDLKEEFSNYKGRSYGPGGITFRYGENRAWNQTHHNFLPNVGDFFIFPSYLAHWVTPFTCEGTRISVAGNVEAILKDE